ncbi:MAG: hypothetical protein M3Q14_01475 [bacterium]|nr:hypothetical protein [bacterium]
MHKLNQEGSLLIPFILVFFLLAGSIGFGAWAYMGRQDYKNNVDAKIQEAVAAAEDKLSAEKESEFTEREKSPYRTYQGPIAFGTVRLTYPKTWSAYVDEGNSDSSSVVGYFHPKFVPDIESETSFALRFEVESTPYDNYMSGVQGAAGSGDVKVSAYRAPKIKSVLGSRVEGEIDENKQGVMIVLPLRDKTIKIWTEGDSFRGDFTKILSQLSFVP